MKTQNLIATALTVALTLVATTMFFWRSGLPVDVQAHPSGTNDSDSNQRAYGTSAPGATGVNPRFERNTPAPPFVTASGLDIARCQFGSERVFNPDTQAEEWRCMRSAYWDFATATLEGMVYSDPEAARVLAHRIKNTDYSRALLLASRSTALSGGNITPLLEARRWRPIVQANGDPDLSGMGQAYVLSELAQRIQSNTRIRSERYATSIMHNAADPAAVLQDLDGIVERMLLEIQQIELDVTGQSTIGGDDDA